MTCCEAEALLNAYLDDELTMTECAAVQQHMAQCRTCEMLYEKLAALRVEIRSVDLRYDPPASLPLRVEGIGGKRRGMPAMRGWGFVPIAAGALALLAIALFAPGRAPERDVQAEALQDHARSLLAMHLLDVPSSDRHTVKPWFQGKADVSPFVPNLDAEGFTLAGGRLDVLAGRRVPAIVYLRGKHVINVFELPAGGRDAPVRTAEVNGYNVVHWNLAGIAYWAVSDVNVEDLRRLAALMGQ
jgi:anti-sigma factor RsiW